MNYVPFQQWVTESVLKTPSVFQRGATRLTDYDPVATGNVVPGEVDITDPGQLGRSNLPSLHTANNVRDPHVSPDLAAVDTLTATIPRAMRWIGLRGSSYNPFSFTDAGAWSTTEYDATTGVAQMPFGPAGAGRFETDIPEHGPITVEELEKAKNVRQPRNLTQRSFLRKILGLPEKTYGPDGAHDERVIPGTGRESKDQDRLTDAAAGVNNQFTIPDVRRTFDEPKDMPPGTPTYASGAPIMAKAGFPLTPTPLEGSDHEVLTGHAYPNFNALTETPVGSPVQRVRAGVQYDLQSTRPATMPHWFDFRPFDQAIAHGNLALKGQLQPRLVSRPIMTSDDPQADVPWSAGRRYTMPAAGMNPIGIHPNIDRTVPQAWDTDAYLESPVSVDQRASRWRLG